MSLLDSGNLLSVCDILLTYNIKYVLFFTLSFFFSDWLPFGFLMDINTGWVNKVTLLDPHHRYVFVCNTLSLNYLVYSFLIFQMHLCWLLLLTWVSSSEGMLWESAVRCTYIQVCGLEPARHISACIVYIESGTNLLMKTAYWKSWERSGSEGTSRNIWWIIVTSVMI